jgi:excisionase family DNA binding protein
VATEPKRRPRPEAIALPIRQPQPEIQIGSYDFSRLPLTLTTDQVVELTGLGRDKIREAAARGDLPVIDVPGMIGNGKKRFKTTTVIRWIESMPERTWR